MYILYDDEQSYPFCRLELLIKKFGHCLIEQTNEVIIKVPKVLSQRRRERDYKILGTKDFPPTKHPYFTNFKMN